MLKLLDTFTGAPSPINARKLVAYITKHPMTVCVLSALDMETIERAKLIADQSRQKPTILAHMLTS